MKSLQLPINHDASQNGRDSTGLHAMPNPIQWHEKLGLVTVTVSGAVKGGEFVRAYKRILLDRRYRPDVHVVWDCREITFIDLDWSQLVELREVAENYEEPAGRGCFVFIVSRKVVFAAAISASTLMHRPAGRKKVFESLGDAAAWLKVSDLEALLAT